MKTIAVLLISLSLAGCAAFEKVKDMLPSSWDANEAAAVTDIRYLINKVDCTNAKTALETTTKIEERKEWLWIYADTRKSKDVLQLIRPFNETSLGLHNKAKDGEMSKGFCLAKVTLMSKQADAIAKALQSRNK